MSMGGFHEPPIIKTTGGVVQLLSSESGSVIVAAFAGATSFRLPPIASISQNHRFTFLNTVDQNMAILPPLTSGYVGASLTLGALNNAAAASVTFLTAGQRIGASISVRAINGKYWVTNNTNAAAATVV